VVGICNEEQQKKIKHKEILEEAWSKKDNSKGKEFSKP
jgi:hypothetical protein